MLISNGEDGRISLLLVDLATMAEKPLPLPPGLNSALSARPFTADGRQLLISHGGADTPSDLAALDLASGRSRALTQLAMRASPPPTSPSRASSRSKASTARW